MRHRFLWDNLRIQAHIGPGSFPKGALHVCTSKVEPPRSSV